MDRNSQFRGRAIFDETFDSAQHFAPAAPIATANNNNNPSKSEEEIVTPRTAMFYPFHVITEQCSISRYDGYLERHSPSHSEYSGCIGIHNPRSAIFDEMFDSAQHFAPAPIAAANNNNNQSTTSKTKQMLRRIKAIKTRSTKFKKTF